MFRDSGRLGGGPESAAVGLAEPPSKYKEEASLLEAGPEFLYTYRHRPLGGVRGFALVCSPLHRDALTNYRREVALARRLAMAGVSVVRFHYRGTGNSSGDPAELTLRSMGQDAIHVADRIAEPVVPSVVIGSRIGALAALAALRHMGGTHLVLWDPLFSVQQYLRALSRARRVYVLAEGVSSPPDPKEEMARGEPLDMLGDLVHPAFYQQSELSNEPIPAAGVLVVRTGGRSGAEIERVRGLVAAPVEVQVVAEAEEWVLADDKVAPDESRVVSQQLVERTAAWAIPRLG